MSGLISLDFASASGLVNRTLTVDTLAKIFPEALPFVWSIYDTHQQTFATGPDWTTPRYTLVEEGVQQGDPLGLSLFADALQLVLVTAHRSSHSSESSVAIRAHLDDVSVTGSPLGASVSLTGIRIVRGNRLGS